MRFCLGITLLLLAVQTQCRDENQIRTNPCPNVYSYDWEEDRGWYGVIRIVPPRKFSELHLVTAMSLIFYRRKAGNGSLILDGDVQAIAEKARLGERQELRFNLFFPPYKDLPRITSIKFNGQEFCPKSYSDTVVTIGNQLHIVTGVNNGVDNGNDFKPIGEENTGVTSSPVDTRNGGLQVMPTYQCGRVNKNPVPVPLLTSASPTKRGDWPWHVAIFKLERDENGRQNLTYHCGGSLIGLKAVVTAAHCVTHYGTVVPLETKVLSLYFGKYHLDDKRGVQKGRIESILVHPSFKVETYFGDVAILTLKETVIYNYVVRPVCLWSNQNTDISHVVGLNVPGTVVGWGKTEYNQISLELKAAPMPVISRDDCIRLKPSYYSHYTSDTTFCAGYINGTSACNGDSGGGLVINSKQPDFTEIWFLRGLVSTGSKKGYHDVTCDPKFYVIFTDLAKYLSFLEPYVSF